MAVGVVQKACPFVASMVQGWGSGFRVGFRSTLFEDTIAPNIE